jgi:hypothetical protein
MPQEDGMCLWHTVEDGGYAGCEEHSEEKSHVDTVYERRFRRREGSIAKIRSAPDRSISFIGQTGCPE